MAVEWLTYSDIGERLGCSAEAARARAIRHEWSRRTGNDGRTECKVDIEEFVAAIPPYHREKATERPVAARSTPEPEAVDPPSDGRAIEALEQHITMRNGVGRTANGCAPMPSGTRQKPSRPGWQWFGRTGLSRLPASKRAWPICGRS